MPIDIPTDFTASNLEKEHRLYYFREDFAINLHYWQWHLLYPAYGNIRIVNKDRRGELFFYHLEQILTR